MTTHDITVQVETGSAAVLLAAVRNAINANYLTSADVSSIGYVVTNLSTGLSPYTGIGGDITVHDTLVTNDGRWTANSTGYNLSVIVPGTAWPTDGCYRVTITITPTSGYAFVVRFRAYAS